MNEAEESVAPKKPKSFNVKLFVLTLVLGVIVVVLLGLFSGASEASLWGWALAGSRRTIRGDLGCECADRGPEEGCWSGARAKRWTGRGLHKGTGGRPWGRIATRPNLQSPLPRLTDANPTYLSEA